MTATQTFTKLSPAEATTEATQALAAAGIAVRSVSTSPQEVGRQRKVFLMTVASGRDGADALAVLSALPDVCKSGTIGPQTAYIYRRLA